MSIEDIVATHAEKPGPLLPILNDVQAAYGHISEAAIKTIAAELNVTRAHVYGVVSFYHDYRRAPSQKPVIKLCGAEACQARGLAALEPESTAGEKVVIETVYCLGLCSVGPAALVGDEVHARLDKAGLKALVDKVAG